MLKKKEDKNMEAIGDWVRFRQSEVLNNHIMKSELKEGQIIGQRQLKGQAMNIVHLKKEGNVQVLEKDCQLITKGELNLK